VLYLMPPLAAATASVSRVALMTDSSMDESALISVKALNKAYLRACAAPFGYWDGGYLRATGPVSQMNEQVRDQT
jgi:hypothetical protein